MKYCANCGSQIADNASFCTYCGANTAAQPAPNPAPAEAPVNNPAVQPAAPAANYQQQVYTQPVYSAPETPVKTQRAPGKSITGFVLGICGMSMGIIGVIFAFCALFRYLGLAMMIYAIVFGLFSIGCSIPGMILSSNALDIEPGNNKARLGKTFSLVGIITGGVAIVFGIIFGIIGISRW